MLYLLMELLNGFAGPAKLAKPGGTPQVCARSSRCWLLLLRETIDGDSCQAVVFRNLREQNMVMDS